MLGDPQGHVPHSRQASAARADAASRGLDDGVQANGSDRTEHVAGKKSSPHIVQAINQAPTSGSGEVGEQVARGSEQRSGVDAHADVIVAQATCVVLGGIRNSWFVTMPRAVACGGEACAARCSVAATGDYLPDAPGLLARMLQVLAGRGVKY